MAKMWHCVFHTQNYLGLRRYINKNKNNKFISTIMKYQHKTFWKFITNNYTWSGSVEDPKPVLPPTAAVGTCSNWRIMSVCPMFASTSGDASSASPASHNADRWGGDHHLDRELQHPPGVWRQSSSWLPPHTISHATNVLCIGCVQTSQWCGAFSLNWRKCH